jgi:hypothetical protein
MLFSRPQKFAEKPSYAIATWWSLLRNPFRLTPRAPGDKQHLLTSSDLSKIFNNDLCFFIADFATGVGLHPGYGLPPLFAAFGFAQGPTGRVA